VVANEVLPFLVEVEDFEKKEGSEGKYATRRGRRRPAQATITAIEGSITDQR